MLIKYLSDLNKILVKYDLETKYQFSYTKWPDGFIFELEETQQTGQTFSVFSSEDPLPNDIEDKYEKNIITYKEVIFEMIKRNINIHRANLSEVNNILFKIENKKEE
jgi:hypothetical protein